VGPALLLEDDTRLAGWWPVTRRELVQARLALLVGPALQATAALAAIPLLVLAITGRPPVLAAASLGVGLLLQTCGVTFAVAAGVVIAARRAADGGRRLAELLGSGSPTWVVFALFATWPHYGPWLLAHPRVHLFLPPLWFAAWAAPLAGGRLLAQAAAGAVATLALASLGLRILVPRRSGTPLVPRRAAPPRRHWSGLVDLLLRPGLTDREGRVVRLLLAAHLREDGRQVGAMALFPLVLAMELFLFPARPVAPLPGALSALLEIPNAFFVLFMMPYAVPVLLYSSRADAYWIVRLGALRTWPLLMAMRRLAHVLVMAPCLAVYILRAATLGMAPAVIAGDVLLLAALADTVQIGMLHAYYAAPFAWPHRREQSLQYMGPLLLGGALALGAMLLAALYASGPWGMAVTWGLVLAAHTMLRRRLAARAAREPLRVPLPGGVS